MNNVEKFLNEKICMDINSEEQDVVTLSQIIVNEYPEFIVPQEGAWATCSDTLHRYWVHAKEKGWALIFVEQESHIFDAYREEGGKRYRVDHPMFTAAKILEDYKQINIDENEIMSLFEVAE